MSLKLKLRRIGNSLGVILPREEVKGYNAGDDIEVEIGGKQGDVITEAPSKQGKLGDVITKPHWWCHKHNKWNEECGC